MGGFNLGALITRIGFRVHVILVVKNPQHGIDN